MMEHLAIRLCQEPCHNRIDLPDHSLVDFYSFLNHLISCEEIGDPALAIPAQSLSEELVFRESQKRACYGI